MHSRFRSSSAVAEMISTRVVTTVVQLYFGSLRVQAWACQCQSACKALLQSLPAWQSWCRNDWWLSYRRNWSKIPRQFKMLLSPNAILVFKSFGHYVALCEAVTNAQKIYIQPLLVFWIWTENSGHKTDDPNFCVKPTGLLRSVTKYINRPTCYVTSVVQRDIYT